jgi:uncharacterized protein YprB with RNaseH-like and TPR domain
MKRISSRIAIILAGALISALPAFAAEGMDSNMKGMDQQNQKDECLLMSKNCIRTDPMQSDSIQQRISRISHEISKGTAVYTSEELMRLNNQLRDANSQLEMLEISGGS